MTALKGTQAMLLVDQFNFSGVTSGFGIDVAMSEEDATDLESTAMEYEPILPMMTIGQNGFIHGLTSNDLEKQLKDRLGVADSIVTALLGISVTGCPAYTINATYGQTMNIAAPANGLLTLEGAWGKARGGYRGLRIYTGTLSATGAQAAIDFGSAGSSGGYAVLHVETISGSATNAAIKVQSSATEGGVYDDEATFTFSAVEGYQATLSGTVNRWLRANLTSLGGATSIKFHLMAYVKGVTM